jgi:hypothetical protein
LAIMTPPGSRATLSFFCRGIFLSLPIFLVIIHSDHAVFDVIVDDEVEFLVGESVMPVEDGLGS